MLKTSKVLVCVYLLIGMVGQAFSFYKMGELSTLVKDPNSGSFIKKDDIDNINGEFMKVSGIFNKDTGICLFYEFPKEGSAYKTIDFLNIRSKESVQNIHSDDSVRNFNLAEPNEFSSGLNWDLYIDLKGIKVVDLGKHINAEISPSVMEKLIDNPNAEEITFNVNNSLWYELGIMIKNSREGIVKITNGKVVKVLKDVLLEKGKQIYSEESYKLLENSEILAVWHLFKDGQKMVGLAADKKTGQFFHWTTDLGESIKNLLIDSTSSKVSEVDKK